VPFETILYEKDGRVVTITLNRPEKRNAFNVAMAGELREAWFRVKKDPEVVCAIVTGAGEKAFCTGMDVADVASGDAKGTASQDRAEAPWFQLTAIQNRCWKPVITAVNGMCCGGGLHFVADSDLILAAEDATFFDTHVAVGLMALLGGSERMGAEEARAVGLVGEVLPRDRLLPRAHELAAKIAQHSPTALARTKRAIWESLDKGLDEALEDTWKQIQDHTAHPDLDEGPRAFVEKRKPRWAPFTE